MERDLHANVKSTLLNNTPFVYAHLVKFERPNTIGNLSKTKASTNKENFTYITDASVNLSFDDGSENDKGGDNGAQTYRAQKVLKVGAYSETITAKATNMNLVLDSTALDASVTAADTFEFSGATIITTGDDFLSLGFREGDKITITGATTAANNTSVNITKFTNSNKTITVEASDADATFTSFGGSGVDSANVTIKVASPEIQGPLFNNPGDDSAPAYANRAVFIYKAFLDPDDYTIIGTPNLVFKGFINSTRIKEDPEKNSQVTWQLTSHWGDFNLVAGRSTNNASHRGLNPEGFVEPAALLRPQYAYDLGFMHADVSLSTMARYSTRETRQKLVGRTRRSFWRKRKVYTLQNENYTKAHEVDLSIEVQSDRLPVVYGVQFVEDPVIVFADTSKTTVAGATTVYRIDALCEGEIQGVYDFHIEDFPRICVNESDATDRGGDPTDGSSGSNEQPGPVCYGNAVQGHTLKGGAYASSSAIYAAFVETAGYASDARTLVDGIPTIVTETTAFHNASFPQRAEKMATAVYRNPSEPSDVHTRNTDGRGITDGQIHRGTDPNDFGITIKTGSSHQQAHGGFVALAAGEDFKRQSDYWESDKFSYWGPNHRLLDTAYAAIRCRINADETEIPDIKYVVKGKKVECFNYDYSYEPTDAADTDVLSNFPLGQEVSIVAIDASSGSGNVYVSSAIIIDKFSHFDGTSEIHRFRIGNTLGEPIDISAQLPSTTRTAGAFITGRVYTIVSAGNTNFTSVGAANSTPGTTFTATGAGSGTGTALEIITQFRMKNGDNYWPMQIYSHKIQDGQELGGPLEVDATGVSGTGTNAVVYTVASVPSWLTNDTEVLLHPKASASSATSTFRSEPIYIVTVSGTSITLKNTANAEKFRAAHTISGSGDELPRIVASRKVKLQSSLSDTAGTYDGKKLILYRNTPSGVMTQERVITNYIGGSDSIAEVSVPWDHGFSPDVHNFSSSPYDSKEDTYDMQNNIRDARVTINPAMQLLDYMTGVYGKNLDLDDDIDLATFQLAGRTCDTPSDITLTVGGSSPITVAAGDVYKKVDTAGALVWQAQVKTAGTYAVGSEIVFTNCIGKINRVWDNYTSYTAGTLVKYKGLVYTRDSGGGTVGSPPTNLTAVTTFTIAKVTGSGSSPATITLDSSTTSKIKYSLYDADDVKYWRYYGWESRDQRWATRHQVNATVDTKISVFQNVNSFLQQFNGILAYQSGKYSLSVATQTDTISSNISGGYEQNARYITNEDIIGSVDVKDAGPKKSFNSVEATISDPAIKWEDRQISFYDSNYLKADRGVKKGGNILVSGITNYQNARIAVENYLRKSRFGLSVTFTMGPKGLILLAGDTIKLTYDRFSWSDKVFRITNLQFKEDCTVQVSAHEYDDSMYTITGPTAIDIENLDNKAGLASPVKPPTTLAAETSLNEIKLTWTRADDASANTVTEVWMRVGTNNRTGATLIHTTGGIENSYTYSEVTEIGPHYFWVRHRRALVGSQGISTNVITARHSDYFPSSATAGVEGKIERSDFTPYSIWTFPSDNQSWASTNATLTHQGAAKTTLFEATGAGPFMHIGSLSVTGSENPIIRAKVLRKAGSGWAGTVFYTTSGHGHSASYQKVIAVDPTVTDEYTILEWDMASLSAGGDDWTTSTITGIRLDLGTTSSDDFLIDWIAVGKHDLGLSGTVGAVEGVNTFDSGGDLITSINNSDVVSVTRSQNIQWVYDGSNQSPSSDTFDSIVEFSRGTSVISTVTITFDYDGDDDPNKVTVSITATSGEACTITTPHAGGGNDDGYATSKIVHDASGTIAYVTGTATATISGGGGK